MINTADVERVTTIGQLVTYSFAVSNVGNVTITDLAVNEAEFTGAGTISAVSCPDQDLAPGASTTCTATYEILAADFFNG